jgi:hypothetical protein
LPLIQLNGTPSAWAGNILPEKIFNKHQIINHLSTIHSL